MSTTDTIRAAFEAAYLSANGFHTKAELATEWKDGMLSSHMFRAGWQAATEAAKATGTAGDLPEPTHEYFDYQRNHLVRSGGFSADQMREYGQSCAEAARLDADAAKRLRLICKLVGIESHVPADDQTLWGAAFAVLGQVRAALEAARQPAPVMLSDEEILTMASQHGVESREFSDECVISLVRAALAATNRSQPVAMPPAIAVSRDAESPSMTGVLVTFARPLSDGQLRELHEYLNRSQP